MEESSAKKAKNMIELWKRVGETPLEALERYRAAEVASGRSEIADVPMTYAGRLDPMAEGVLLVLIGDECKKKDLYLGLDKEYEVEVVFGLATDTYDALGLVSLAGDGGEDVSLDGEGYQSGDICKNDENFVTFAYGLGRYIGRLTQEYPPYSSKTIDGKQLHELARAGDLPEEMPTKEVEIYEIEKLGEREISAGQLLVEISDKIALVKGDFRQKEILARWKITLGEGAKSFKAINIRVKCSSGTYMRSLAHRMGKDAGTGAFALSIKRTKILS